MSADDSEPPDSIEQVLREAHGDRLARAVARARIGEKLFATKDEVTLGRYRVIEQVGTGGMGVVWGAWDPELERRVAIKVMKPQVAVPRERVVREGKALAKLSHPNVVPVYDVGVVDDDVYLVMEWVQGETLRAWLAAEPRTPSAIVRAYREAAMGLAAAHDAGLVHRDFKPENAMIGRDGRVRVLDFGLAGVGGARDVAGTPRYMAPEQQVGAEQTPAVDQYAFGVALREALPAAAPSWLVHITTRATATDPGERFASMHDIVEALGNDPAHVRRRRIAIAAALAVAAGAFAIGATVISSPSTWKPTIEPHQPAYDENAATPVISPDGAWIAYTSDRERANWFRVYVAPVRGGEGRAVTSPERNALGVRWSHDGRSLLFTDAADDYTLYRVALDGGTLEVLAQHGAFGEDCGGRLLVSHLGTPGCSSCERLVLRADGSEREVLRVDGEYFVGTVRCDRAGKRAVYVRSALQDARAPSSLWLLELDTGVTRRLTDGRHRDRAPVFHPDGRSIVFASDRAGPLNLWELPATGGVPRQLTFGPGRDGGAAIAPDGSVLVFNVADVSTPLFVRELTGAKRRITQTRPELAVQQVTPDGTEVIAISADRTRRRVVSIRTADGTERALADGIAASITPSGDDVVFATAPPTTIRAIARSNGAVRDLAQIDGEVEELRAGGDGFVHLQVKRVGAREAWRVPVAGGPAEREAEAPWCFVDVAPSGGYRVARRCYSDRPPVVMLVLPNAPLDLATPGLIGVSGTWDAGATAYFTYDHTDVRRIDAATGAITILFDAALATGIAPSPDGKLVYTTEQVGRARRYLITNFADR